MTKMAVTRGKGSDGLISRFSDRVEADYLKPKDNPEDYYEDAPRYFGVDNPYYPEDIDSLYYKDGWLTLSTWMHGVTLNLTFANSLEFIGALKRAHKNGSRNKVSTLFAGNCTVSAEEYKGERVITVRTVAASPKLLMRVSSAEADDILQWWEDVRHG